MRMLVVDDDKVIQVFLEDLLSEHGEVALAADGEEGVELFAEALDADRPFDLVFLDLMLPGIDGHQALETMRAEESRRGVTNPTRVIISSARDDEPSVTRAFFRGDAVSYLTKPLTPEGIVRELAKFS